MRKGLIMAFFKKALNGITEKTTEHIQLDAGAFFKNYDPATDTYETAKKAGKCLGATQGGGTFTAKCTLRSIEVDGTVGRVKGLTDIESWEVSISATFIETTVDTLRMALTAATATKGTGTSSGGNSIPEGYTKIVGNSGIADGDYVDNITWVGNISGSEDPIMIQVFNGLNEDGLSYSMQPKSEGKVGVTIYGYNDVADFMNGTVNPPFAILYPTGE